MLRRRIEHLEAQERELRAARDELASRLEEEHGEEAVERRGHEARIVDLTDEVRSLNRTIRMMQSTKVWQLGERYWAVRDAAKRLLGRA
jgi:chromosome segregation ATPase